MNNEYLQFIIFFTLFLIFTLFQRSFSKLLRKVVCPICFATTLTWIVLGTFYFFPTLNPWKILVEPLFLVTLMGGSVVGLSSLLDHYLKEFSQKKAMIKGTIIIIGFLLTYFTIALYHSFLFIVMVTLFVVGYSMMETIKIKEEVKQESLFSNPPSVKSDKKKKITETKKEGKSLDDYLKDCC